MATKYTLSPTWVVQSMRKDRLNTVEIADRANSIARRKGLLVQPKTEADVWNALAKADQRERAA